jgi:hypothetical protein
MLGSPPQKLPLAKLFSSTIVTPLRLLGGENIKNNKDADKVSADILLIFNS